MNNLPPLEDLRVFCLVAQRASFVAAAEELGNSPAYVSKRVKALEQAMGAQLLHRSTRQVSLTESGDRVCRWARHMLDEIGQLMDDVSAGGGAPRGLVRIGSSVGFGRRHVAPLISTLCDEFPGLEIRFDVFDKLVDLVAEGIDLDIRIGNDIAPHLIARRLARNWRVLCAAPSYLAARGTPQTLDALAQHDCLVTKERDHPFGIWRLTGPEGDRNVKVGGRLSSNHGEIVTGWALAGHGVMLRSMWDVKADLEAGRLVQVLPDYRQDADIWAVYPSRLSGSARLRACVEFFMRHLGDATGESST
ncbi:LysR substrate-binding domain-containing protein [Cupriavidus pinatubonensis]|uniref:HTH-type transcriptional regulator DmlR n=1 Tax=Cupriavidus pinatubonensis TaxID=248026 RepID=A0ABM8X7E2_9BURK|nr:LysR substrate-binding domain-containing protein [Cupriavidus pinatubonensis]CAG9175811.1 HTH-type transcriptional regulator DmlR [Cupriavidus pinatubonensis]